MQQDPDGNFVLIVSNQSSAIPEVEISVKIDGALAIRDTFSIGSGHETVSHTFALADGKHDISASSANGDARYEGTFEIEGKRWASLTYWYEPVDEPGGGSVPRSLQFEISATPIRFR